MLVEGICHAYLKQIRGCFFQKNPVESARSVSPKVPFEVPEKISGQGGMSGKFLMQLLLLIFVVFFGVKWGLTL